jgi:hypothetical protein
MQRKGKTMLKRLPLLPILIIVAINLALAGILFAPEAALAQVATPEPVEEATPEPVEEAAPTEAEPTAAPVEEAAPAEAEPTAAAAEEAAPAPTTLPTTGMAGRPFTILLVVVGTVAVLGTLSGFSARRKRTTQE